ncbi:MAG: hypothetical protein WB723_01995 [Candidatus Acidiferrales bacterium]
MRGEAVAQRVGMDLFLDACALGRLLTGVPRCFRIDGLITVVPTVAWKQPCAGLSRQTAPVLAQFFQQFWAKHHISVNASLAALNVNHHALAVDVADFQVCQLGVPHSGGVERQQQNAMVGSERSIDELRDFFLAQDRRKVQCSFRIRSLSDAPGLFESLDVEKPQRREAVIHGTRRQLLLLKQLSLVFTNVSQAQTVGRKVESSREIFDCAQVITYGIFRVITTLEFLQHHFA